MVPALHLRSDHVAACVGYHAIGDYVLHRVAVTFVTDAAQVGLTWLVVHVAGWVFGGVG